MNLLHHHLIVSEYLKKAKGDITVANQPVDQIIPNGDPLLGTETAVFPLADTFTNSDVSGDPIESLTLFQDSMDGALPTEVTLHDP